MHELYDFFELLHCRSAIMRKLYDFFELLGYPGPIMRELYDFFELFNCPNSSSFPIAYYPMGDSPQSPIQLRRDYEMAKPDDRSDNVRKLQRSVQNTIENMEESEHYLDEHSVELSPDESRTLHEKNERRREAISSMRSEIQDEADAKE